MQTSGYIHTQPFSKKTINEQRNGHSQGPAAMNDKDHIFLEWILTLIGWCT